MYEWKLPRIQEIMQSKHLLTLAETNAGHDRYSTHGSIVLKFYWVVLDDLNKSTALD